MTTISLNTTVKVRLTAAGVRRHRDFHRGFMSPEQIKAHYRSPPEGEELGLSLWELMQIFGPVMTHGGGEEWFGVRLELSESGEKWLPGRYLVTSSDGKTRMIECVVDPTGAAWHRHVCGSECWRAVRWQGCTYTRLRDPGDSEDDTQS